MTTSLERKEHWESIYERKPVDAVSWYQSRAAESMRLIGRYAPPPAAAIDVGGGASVLVDNLLDAGYARPTVLDISGRALQRSQARLGARSASAEWLEGDVTQAELPGSAFDVWHDRAVFHFMTDADLRKRYLARQHRALKTGGVAVMATFAADGPQRCSGLPTCRYSAQQLADELGARFTLLDSCTEDHHTPGGALQRFQYAVFRKVA